MISACMMGSLAPKSFDTLGTPVPVWEVVNSVALDLLLGRRAWAYHGSEGLSLFFGSGDLLTAWLVSCSVAASVLTS